MAINTDFYGLPETWIEVSAGSGCYKTGYTYDNNANYTGSFKALQESSTTNPDNIASPPLDESIIPWKVNEKSDVFNRKYIYPYSDNYTSQQVSTWQYESSQATTVHNGGFRFFLEDYYYINNYSSNGLWSYRYSPLNLKSELYTNVYRLACPLVKFDYSKMYVRCDLLYVSKTTIDDSSQYWSSGTTKSVPLSQLLDENAETWLADKYIYGMNFEIVYNGIGSHSVGMFAFDELQPTAYAGGYYPYGSKYKHYQNAITLMHDTGQMGRSCIGGVIGGNGSNWSNRWDSTNHTDIVELYLHNYTETNIPKIVGGIEESGLLNSKAVSSSTSAQLRLFPRIFNSLGVSGILEYARKEMSYLGFRFSEYGNPTDEQLYLPEINSQGITTGNYKKLSEATDYTNYDWSDDVFEKTPYDYENDVATDPNTYDDNKTVLNTLSAIYDRFTNEYILNGTQLLSLKNVLYSTISSEVDSSFWSDQKFLTNNPLDVIKGLTFYPFDVANAAPNTGTLDYNTIILGTIDTEVNATALIDSFVVLDCGSCTYFPVYGVNDFRSYAPYSKAELHIPYCGSVEISPELYLNHTIAVKMIVDLKTGAALALIYRDNMVVDSVGGIVGITIPISGIERETLAAAEHQALSQYKTARNTAMGKIASFALDNKNLLSNVGSFGVVGAAMSAGSVVKKSSQLSDVANSIQNVEDAQYNLQHVEVPYKTIGNASTITAYANEPYCRLIIKRPIMLDGYSQDDFGHCYGFATNKTGVVSDFSGYTKFASIDLSGVSCSESMKAQIKSIMLSGVRL